MDGVLVDFSSGICKTGPAVENEYKNRPDEVPGIFSLMDPMPNAIESFVTLSKLFDTYILSTAPGNNPSAWSDKLLWVQRHLPDVAYKRLILSHNKHLNRGGFLIGDYIKNGAGEFKGALIRFGSADFPDWESVVEYLRGRVEG